MYLFIYLSIYLFIFYHFFFQAHSERYPDGRGIAVTLNCEQSPSFSIIREEANKCARVTCERQCREPNATSGSQVATLLAASGIAAHSRRSQSRSARLLFCILPQGFSRKRETARSLILKALGRKGDQRSEFSNLRNWKEEAWKKSGLLLSNCLNWKIYCDDHSSLSSTTAVQIWIISYKLHSLILPLIHHWSRLGFLKLVNKFWSLCFIFLEWICFRHQTSSSAWTRHCYCECNNESVAWKANKIQFMANQGLQLQFWWHGSYYSHGYENHEKPNWKVTYKALKRGWQF